MSKKVVAFPKDNRQRETFDIIHGAKFGIYEEVEAALRENPKCINQQDASGLTAMHWAAANRDVGIANLLAAHKFDPLKKDIRGRTARDHAIESGEKDIVELLTQRMYGKYLASD